MNLSQSIRGAFTTANTKNEKRTCLNTTNNTSYFIELEDDLPNANKKILKRRRESLFN